MKFEYRFANNCGINIHYIDNEINNKNTTPLLICPGLSESCEDYIKLMSKLGNRRCVALSFRGRGKSDSPNENYTLEDHIKDIEAVVKNLNLEDFCIMGISRGVSYELGYAISNFNSIKGIIIGEYPAVHKKMPVGWAKESMEFYEKYCDSISITYDVLQGIEDDSKDIDFKESLGNIKCDSLILKGELEGTLLSLEDVRSYVDNIGSKSIRIEKFVNAGHDLQDGDFDKLVEVINEFLSIIDVKGGDFI